MLEVVGGGLAEWPSGTGPRGETVAPCAFVDARAAPDLLALPDLFRLDPGAWRATAHWDTAADGSRLLRVIVSVPRAVTADLRFRAPRQGPFLEAIERAACLYVCPTTPQQGVNARLARDASFPVDLAAREG